MSSSAAIVSLRTQALASFKALMRAQQTVFGEDIPRRVAARALIREQFFKKKDAKNEDEIKQAISDANEAALFLRTSIVQAAPKEDGVLKVKLESRHIGENTTLTEIRPKIERKKLSDLKRKSTNTDDA
eukprot:TRINITY_DN3928_c0_g1_i1.p1 TRINITY_DN3928_c0_g1~~TRINITY_DN3928_c0_g1_i1.p1  ORF type:complete len:129 (-),score=40.73 TRINITY_DN3928_c0_g1_i1:120-506(-)